MTGASLAFGEFLFSPLLKTVGKPKWQLFVSSVGTGLFCALMGAVNQHTQGMAIAVSLMATQLSVSLY